MSLPPSIQPIAGALWIPAAGFEHHLYTELHAMAASHYAASQSAQPIPCAEKIDTAVPDYVVSPEQAAAFLCSKDTKNYRYEKPAVAPTLPVRAAVRHNNSVVRTHIGKIYTITGSAPQQLIYSNIPPCTAFWAQLCFEQPFTVQFGSITEAASILRSIQRNWVHYPVSNFRRASLITEKLPYISSKPKIFPTPLPLTDIGVWSLLDAHTLIASAKTSSPFPLGCANFCEDHHNPPSRAYLKLWEALTLLDYYYRQQQQTGQVPVEWALPHQYSRCIDAGACPGGWTWVLRGLGASVTAIDRAPLAEPLMQDSSITFLKHDAFTLSPAALGIQDWVCSDVICYPPRLLKWITQWLNSGLCNKFICTIKIQGVPDTETINCFAAIPHSKILHLSANKHELTWLCAPFIN
ncbi:MAG: SAM-dependent methyltransferase [Treponema sp.]